LPAPGYKQFGLPVKTASTTLAKVKSKIIEFGLLSDIDVEHLTHLLDTLSASSRYHSSKILDEELAVMEKMLSWQQPSQVFPALDLARLVLLHPHAASRERYGYWSRVVPKTIAIMAIESVEGPAAVAIPMLGLRLFSNGLKGGPGSCEAIANNVDAILEVTTRLVPSSNKNVRLALATLLYNTACYVRSNPGTDISDKFFPIVSNVLSSKTYEEEATFRTLVALGTLVMASSDAKEAANASFLSSKVEMAASPHGSAVKAAAKEVYAVLQ
jgi:phospholipase A-2-activating protein